MRQKQVNSSINTSGTAKVADQAPPLPPSKRSKIIIQPTLRRALIRKKAKKVRKVKNQSKLKQKFRFKEMLL